MTMTAKAKRGTVVGVDAKCRHCGGAIRRSGRRMPWWHVTRNPQTNGSVACLRTPSTEKEDRL